MTNSRQPDHPIDPIFIDRWSPRAFDGQPLAQEYLDTLLEAARWAPSSYNAQPWRFLYAHRNTPIWQDFLGLLNPFNQFWASEAAVLAIVLSDTLMQRSSEAPLMPSSTHSFDTGAAWASLALQAGRMGLCTRGMAGIDFAAVRSVLEIPDRLHIECAVAIGYAVDPASLPDELRARETMSARRPVEAWAFEGCWPVTAAQS